MADDECDGGEKCRACPKKSCSVVGRESFKDIQRVLRGEKTAAESIADMAARFPSKRMPEYDEPF